MLTDRLYLLDGHALCYRSFYAIRSLTTSKGQATNAVYGFVNALRKILRVYSPKYMAVCFDSPKKTFRQEKFAEYKIQRPKMPDDLIEQIPMIKDIVQAYHLSIFEFPGFEADDIIATLCRQGIKKGIEVVIISEDKDLYQLASEKVKFLSNRNDEILDYQAVKGMLGFEPQKIVDFIALAGDKTDNIPGIQGIGEVTAEKLIQSFGSLEDIINNLEKVKPEKIKEKIRGNQAQARLSRELAVLEDKVPFNLELEQLMVEGPDKKRLLETFKKLEFRKFASELSEASLDDEKGREVNSLAILNKPSEIKLLIEKIKKQKRFAFLPDTSETGLKGLIICVTDEDSLYIPLGSLKEFMPVFRERGIIKIAFNIKEVLNVLSRSGNIGNVRPLYIKDTDEYGTQYKVENRLDSLTIKDIAEDQFLEENTFDVMLGAYLLSPGKSAYSLGDICWDYLGKDLNLKDPAEAVKSMLYLYPLIYEELKKKSLLELFEKVEIPLAYTLFVMETQGVKLDTALLSNLAKDVDKKISELESELYKIAEEEFNINSPKQLSKILFEKLKLPVIKKTKTGFSTDEEVLTRLAAKNDFPRLVLEYRQLAKLKSTYIDSLPQLINRQTNKIHATFNQAGTETGRLSSSNPNLQNIPIRTELGRQIRKAFVPSQSGMVILAADYSQIELRVLAHLSKDEALIKAFKDGNDIHRYTASLVFEKAEDQVTLEMRNYAKRVNFGIIYGMSSFGLSRDLGVPNEEAQEFIDKYFARYPRVKDFMDKSIRECEEKGYVTTILNRRRYIPEIKSKNNSERQFAQRQAINTPVQGSAADLIKLAMIAVQREIENQGLKCKMIITVHDELVFEAPVEEREKISLLLRDKMENIFELEVPIVVTIKSGLNWLEMKEI
ncbi:MAG: DNA polymerase I [Candidatus Omnitrophica bacterium]|nr:DNA polymerase I [Candidatus Omnitrophota bacterium]